MAVKYSSGKYTQAVCDRCGEWFKLNKLKKLVLKDNVTNIKVCSRCWEPSHPQLRQGQYPVVDAQAVREPRPDRPDSRQVYGGDALLIDDPTLAYYGLSSYLLQENDDYILTEVLDGTYAITEDQFYVSTEDNYLIVYESIG